MHQKWRNRKVSLLSFILEILGKFDVFLTPTMQPAIPSLKAIHTYQLFYPFPASMITVSTIIICPTANA
jgi:hypothetical protein